MKYQIVAITAALSLSIGCATNYRGVGPRFDLTEESAKAKEIETFTIDSGYGNSFTVKGERYTADTFLPVIRQVSPDGYQTISQGRTLNMVGSIAFLVGVLGFGGDLFYFKDATNYFKVFGSALAVSGLGVWLYSDYQVKEGVSQYNYDLRQKVQGVKTTQSFNPTITWTTKF
ncbi:MAG: hypothetical protein AAB425_14710 [Bdellovibrionota bacterium]